MAKLEDERNSLKSSLGDGTLGVDQDVRVSVLSLADGLTDAKRLSMEQELCSELLLDEQDASEVATELRQQEEVFERLERRNAELRSEIQACKPLL